MALGIRLAKREESTMAGETRNRKRKVFGRNEGGEKGYEPHQRWKKSRRCKGKREGLVEGRADCCM